MGNLWHKELDAKLEQGQEGKGQQQQVGDDHHTHHHVIQIEGLQRDENVAPLVQAVGNAKGGQPGQRPRQFQVAAALPLEARNQTGDKEHQAVDKV